MGASWIHGTKGNPITAIAQRIQTPIFESELEEIALFSDEGICLNHQQLEQVYMAYEKVFKGVYKQTHRASSNESIDREFERLIKKQNLPPLLNKALKWVVNSCIHMEYGIDQNQLSLKYWESDYEYSGGHWLFKEGYSSIIEELHQPRHTHLNQIVTHIDYQNKEIIAQTESKQYHFKKLLITVPLGVLKQEKIAFSPPLPFQKQEAIKRLNMGLLNKIFLKFPFCFWPEDIFLMGSLKGQFKGKYEYYNLYKYYKKPIIMVFNKGQNARFLETLPAEDIYLEAFEELITMFGPEIPEPLQVINSKWASDPFSYGSYSHIPPGAALNDIKKLAKPVKKLLYFAGEATEERFPGTVHGAYLSGKREAKKILKQLRKG